MDFIIKQEDNFKYIERGDANNKEPLVLLHGLMGGLSNFTDVIEHFSKSYRVIFPMLPIYDAPLSETSLDGMLKYLSDFVAHKKLNKMHLLGNSLGGHIGLMFTLKYQEKISSLTLTGSSGLYENAMGNSFPKRGDISFIRNKALETFYDPAMVTTELVDELYATINDRNKALHIVMMSKSAVRNNLRDELYKIYVPTLLIWGKQDPITPPFVAEQFNQLIKSSKLVWIDKCCHAPMMEHTQTFNSTLEDFLNEITATYSFSTHV